ncbi:MAG: NAD(P)-dependent oxidoreductase [Granulosicoccus sp.]|nr:NAD(P)-dependent oxidoreductase [Granulosicoccus sp.]
MSAGVITKDALNTDLHQPLSSHESAVESDRCYFCYDAPCVNACPTGIDIPLFIRQISTGNAAGAARTIFDENIFGGMCARVCPTETLCEEACVRNTAEEQPVRIGLLQRYATDYQMSAGSQPYTRAASTGKKVAVVGAGPAGISCAHRLALYGHDVVVFDARPKSGGLNEYGIAAYKTVDDFAQREIDYILGIGGIRVEHGKVLGSDVTLPSLKDDYDAVFVGIGLSDVNDLGIEGESSEGVEDAIEFIARLRQSNKNAELSVGRRVVVIGGGMTAIDAAVQSRILGAEDVLVAYRRGLEDMNASVFEQELAQKNGVMIKPWWQPVRVISSENNTATGVEFEYTSNKSGKLAGTGEKVTVAADHVLKAIGQRFNADPLSGAKLDVHNRRLVVDEQRRTSDAKIWAGGDCIADGEDLTVSAVQDGKLAAESIHASFN